MIFIDFHPWCLLFRVIMPERDPVRAICSAIPFKHAVDISLISLLFRSGHLLNVQDKRNDKFDCWNIFFLSWLYAHVVLQKEPQIEKCTNSYCNHCHLAIGPVHFNSLTIFEYI